MSRFALVQMCAGTDRERNLDEADRWIEAAVAEKVDLIVLPEVFSGRGSKSQEIAMGEDVPGPTTEWIAERARQNETWILGGSVLERNPSGAPPWNTALLFSSTGDLVATYRKLHLFDVELPEVTVRETERRSAGDDVVVADTPFGKLGLSICYDLRFPELYREQSRQGATILAVPSAFTATTGEAHWEPLLRARAIENQAWVLAANQTGKGPGGWDDWGHSMIVDPWGRMRGLCEGGPGLVVADCPEDELIEVRRRLPALEHRRDLPPR